MSSNSTFDPISQNVTVLKADGITPAPVTISDLDAFFLYNCQLTINYGAQLGACFVMLIVTAILSKESKRGKPVFLLNILSLLLGFLRALFLALYSVSPWTDLWAYATQDLGRIPEPAYAISIAGTVFPLLMTATLNASLVIQTHTVAKDIAREYYYVVSGVSCIVYLLALGFRFAEAVTNSRTIISNNSYFDYAWITAATLATETMAIWYYSIIFTSKLGWTIYKRKQLGFPRWSYLQILAAMGACTMTIPSGFTILEYIAPSGFPEAGTWSMTMVALLLPLSSLWASMATTERSSSFNTSQLWGSGQSRGCCHCGRKTFGSQSTGTTGTHYSTERKGSTAPINPATNTAVIEETLFKPARNSTEIDLEMMGARVGRSYSICSDRAEKD